MHFASYIIWNWTGRGQRFLTHLQGQWWFIVLMPKFSRLGNMCLTAGLNNWFKSKLIGLLHLVWLRLYEIRLHYCFTQTTFSKHRWAKVLLILGKIDQLVFNIGAWISDFSSLPTWDFQNLSLKVGWAWLKVVLWLFRILSIVWF